MRREWPQPLATLSYSFFPFLRTDTQTTTLIQIRRQIQRLRDGGTTTWKERFGSWIILGSKDPANPGS